MSRAHLYKLLDKGFVPSHYVGRHRRIAMRDLLAFAKRRDAELAEVFYECGRQPARRTRRRHVTRVVQRLARR